MEARAAEGSFIEFLYRLVGLNAILRMTRLRNGDGGRDRAREVLETRIA
jgi:hypothetical protein